VGKEARIRLDAEELELVIRALQKSLKRSLRCKYLDKEALLLNRLERYAMYGLTGRTAPHGLIYIRDSELRKKLGNE
jgi:hypothetical protein